MQHTADAQNGRIGHHAQQHDADELHLLDVVGGAGDEGSSGKILNLCIRKMDDGGEGLPTQVTADGSRHAGSDEAHQNGDPPTRNRYCIWTSCATPCASYSRLTSRVAWLAMLERVVSSICAIALASCCWIISREKPGICAMAANWAHTAFRSAAVGAMVSAAVSSVFSEEAALSAASLEAAGYSERGAMPCAGIPVPLAACEAAIYSTMSGMVTISSREARSSAVRSARSFRTPSS